MDSDGEDKVEDALQMSHKCRETQGTLVIAQRRRRHASLSFRIGYRIFQILFKLLTGTRFRSGNFAAMNVAVLRQIVSNPNSFISYGGTLITLRNTKFIKFDRGKRKYGKSRMNLNSLISHGLISLVPQSARIASRMFMVFICTVFVSTTSLIVSLYIRFYTDLVAPIWTTVFFFGVLSLSGVTFLAFLLCLTMLALVSLLRSSNIIELNSYRNSNSR
jgi:hypothetical protein